MTSMEHETEPPVKCAAGFSAGLIDSFLIEANHLFISHAVIHQPPS